MKILLRIIIIFILAGLAACDSSRQSSVASSESSLTGQWTIGPFRKEDQWNPVLTPGSIRHFICPIRNEEVLWEIKDVFNPAAIVKDSLIYLLYRAEDSVGKYAGTSRIGLAFSSDGLVFDRFPQPVLFPDQDFMKRYEWEGGIEDPRVVEGEDGRYYLTYTAYDGKMARLCIASSQNLTQWEKHGLAFEKAYNGEFVDQWSKSGSIVCRREGQHMIATKIKDFFWMYWGDTKIFLARSRNLVDWVPVKDNAGNLKEIFGPREGYFDSDLVEPGPPAILTENGIILIYNSRYKSGGESDPALPEGTYSAGQVLLDPENPSNVIDRTESYFISPDRNYEMTGQVGNVCFVEGLSLFKMGIQELKSGAVCLGSPVVDQD